MDLYRDLQKKFNALKGASFIAIKNYENSFKELENVVINTNISTKTAKLKDLAKLESLNQNDLIKIAEKYNLNLKEVELNFNELLESQRKNVSEYENRTKQSKALSEAFDNQNNGTKYLLKDNTLTIYGFLVSKKIIKEGNRPQPNNKGKTYIKNKIKEYCGFHMLNYRTYKLQRIKDCININHETVEIKL